MLNKNDWQNRSSIKRYNRKFTEPFGEEFPFGSGNTIFSKNCMLSGDEKTGLNNNALIVGKRNKVTDSFILPNLLQAFGSYVIVDRSGDIKKKTEAFFREKGYDIRVFDLTDMRRSLKYNPFRYLNIHRDDNDIKELAECLMNGMKKNSISDDLKVRNAAELLLEAVILYMFRYLPEEEQNLSYMREIFKKGGYDHTINSFRLDDIFLAIERNCPDDPCVPAYKKAKDAMKMDSKFECIPTLLYMSLSVFGLDSVKALTSSDEIDLDSFGKEPSVLYIVIPVDNDLYKPLTSALLAQLYASFVRREDAGKSSPCHTKVFLRDVGSLGVIPDIEDKMRGAHRYDLSYVLCAGSMTELINTYPAKYISLTDACDVAGFYGNLSSISERDMAYVFAARNAYTPVTEFVLQYLPEGKCIVSVTGQRTFNDDVYDLTEHKNYLSLTA